MNRSNPNSCAQLLELAASAQISLVFPAFSLAEPHDAVSRRTKARSRLVQDLEPQLRELGRTKALRHLPSAFAALIGVMKESGRTERQGVRQSVAGLLGAAQVIPLDEAIIRAATELQERFQISGQDAMVLASVLSDLEKRKSTRRSGNPGGTCRPELQILPQLQRRTRLCHLSALVYGALSLSRFQSLTISCTTTLPARWMFSSDCA